MKITKVLLFAFVLIAFNGSAATYWLFDKKGRGLFGYDKVTNYPSEIVNGDKIYSTTCFDPGFSRCIGVAHSASPNNPNGSLDEIAGFYGYQFMEDMNQDSEVDINNGVLMGEKTRRILVTNPEGRNFSIVVKFSWKPSNGGFECVGSAEAVEIIQ